MSPYKAYSIYSHIKYLEDQISFYIDKEKEIKKNIPIDIEAQIIGSIYMKQLILQDEEDTFETSEQETEGN